MIKNILLQHKLEKEKLLAKEYVPRQRLDFAKKFLDTNLIKLVTGPRRAGKSIFSLMLLKEKEFAYLNFDDENLLLVKNYDEIVRAVAEVYPQVQYILFDEIQNLANWELFVNKLQRRGLNLVLTGSNSQMLSSKLASTLTGRYIPIEIFPFNFSEFMTAKKFVFDENQLLIPETKGNFLHHLDSYVRNGGFPEVVVADSLDSKVYLETLIDAILLRDVVKRHKIRYPQEIYNLAVYLISNFCAEFSFNKLKNILRFKSTLTLQKYLSYLEEAYVLFSLNRFSYKVKEQLNAPKKIYIVDNGFILAKSFQFSPNIGKLMENLVFIALSRMGYKANKSFFYYKTRNSKEVDFVLKKETKINGLIQVCFDIANEEIKSRELKSLIEAGEEKELDCNNLIVVNWDYEAKEEFRGKTIQFIPLWKIGMQPLHGITDWEISR